MNNNPI